MQKKPCLWTLSRSDFFSIKFRFISYPPKGFSNESAFLHGLSDEFSKTLIFKQRPWIKIGRAELKQHLFL